MDRGARDLYAVLGVAGDASPEEITHAYRRLLRRHHPDTRDTQTDAAWSDAELLDVLAAYAVLRNPQLRAEYDRRHSRPAEPAPAGQAGTSPPRSPQCRSMPRPARGAGSGEPPLRVGPLRWRRDG